MSTNSETGAPEGIDLLPKAFALALRVEAVRAGMNQTDLVKATGMSKGTIGNYWHGVFTPRLKELKILARALGIGDVEFYAKIMAEYARVDAEAAKAAPEGNNLQHS